MLLVIAFSIAGGIGSLLLIGGAVVKSHSSDWNTQERGTHIASGGAITLILVAIIAVCWLGIQYADSLSLPAKVEALKDTITEQRAMLSTVSQQDIQLGLEGIQMKKTIQDTIREYNMTLARVRYLQRNPWVFFKPQLKMQVVKN